MKRNEFIYDMIKKPKQLTTFIFVRKSYLTYYTGRLKIYIFTFYLFQTCFYS